MRKNLLIALACGLLFATNIEAQNGYSNYAQQSARIDALAKSHPQLVKTRSITKTAGGKDIWMITIGNGNTETKHRLHRLH